MEEVFSTLLLNLLTISITFSVILMALIQKFKCLSFFNKSWHAWILNFLLSFLLGIPFSMTFYNISFKNSIWVGVFSFIGAPSIYQALKSQKIINYKPISISEKTQNQNSNESEINNSNEKNA